MSTGWLNGSMVPVDELVVSVADRGFTLGDAAYEIARTYRHEPFRLERHLARLYDSLDYLGIQIPFEPDRMHQICHEVLDANRPGLDPDDDVMIVMRVTRGIAAPLYGPIDRTNPPTVVVHLAPLPFANLAAAHRTGMHLIPSSTHRRTPPSSLDPQAKTHERLNLVLAHVEVGRIDPFALPVLLDGDGHVTETITANIFAVVRGRLSTPRHRAILPGITRATVLELAKANGLDAAESDLTVADLRGADEVFLTATSFGIMPVGRFDGVPVGAGAPGPVTARVIGLFADLAGLDPRTQALERAGAAGHD